MDQRDIVTGKPVAVIGAGVSGLVAAKRLAAEGFQVDVYDRRSQPGGLWNFSADPNAPFASAVYGGLQTNFPRQLMELQDYPWTNQPLFMKHNLVQAYLAGYARNIEEHCNGEVRFYFDTEVVRLFEFSLAGGHWELICKSVITGGSITRPYLYVVVAVGVYDELSIPPYEGLPAWVDMWKDSVSHAKTYRSPDAFIGKNVLIVGYQASGFDIANKIATSVSKLWISSTRPLAGGAPSKAMLMTGVFCFYAAQRKVRFSNGLLISEVDHIIFCTGYQYHQPFIKKSRYSDEPLFPSGTDIEGLHEHVIYEKNTSLAFIGMVRDAVPTFLVVQAQAAFVSRVFSGRLQCSRRQKESSRHRLPYPLFMDYLLRLERLCEESDRGQKWRMTRFFNPVFRWTWELDLIRTKRREIREAFLAQQTLSRRIWSSTDTIHEYHCKYLSLSPANIRALVPFLILSCGYDNDNGPYLILPFEGWEADLGLNLAQCFRDGAVTLSSLLEKGSQDVITRGADRLWSLFMDRWGTNSCGMTDSMTRKLEGAVFGLWKRSFQLQPSEDKE